MRFSATSFLGPADRAGHPLGRRREDQLGAQRLEQTPPLEAHALGHGHAQAIAAGGAHVRQADTGVAAGGLDDHGVAPDQTVALRRVDHRPGDAILDAPKGIETLELGDDRSDAAVGQPAHADQRRIADAISDVVEDPAASHGRDLPHRKIDYQLDTRGRIISMLAKLVNSTSAMLGASVL